MSQLCKSHVSFCLDAMLTFSDVNARFSGISLEQLDTAVMEIQAVRSAALMFIGPDTVLVGHG